MPKSYRIGDTSEYHTVADIHTAGLVDRHFFTGGYNDGNLAH